MDQQTIPTSLAPEVIIQQVHGNLQVEGWEDPQVKVDANPSELTLQEQEDVVRLGCQGNCSVRLPAGATLQVQKVNGEARFRGLKDQLTIEQVQGSLSLRNVSDTHVERVDGELLAKHIGGDLFVVKAAGNAQVRDVQGACTMEQVDGNLELRDVEGDVKVAVAGNAQVRLSVLSGDDYQIQADGNIHCRIPEDASVIINFTSDGETIQVKLLNQSRMIKDKNYSVTLGNGDATMNITADGAIFLKTQAEEPAAADFDADIGEGFEGVYDEFSQQIAQQVEAQLEAQMEALTRQLNEQMATLSVSVGKAGLSEQETEQIIQRARISSERATAQAQEKMRRAQERLERKLEAARRRSEMKAQAAERRAQFHGRRSWNIEFPTPPPTPAKEPVSDEERLMILRMLEQKKITLEQAEELLSALEGKNE
jgi:DUF4097 and DUF4098 domain-containing protein YvlB